MEFSASLSLLDVMPYFLMLVPTHEGFRNSRCAVVVSWQENVEHALLVDHLLATKMQLRVMASMGPFSTR